MTIPPWYLQYCETTQTAADTSAGSLSHPCICIIEKPNERRQVLGQDDNPTPISAILRKQTQNRRKQKIQPPCLQYCETKQTVANTRAELLSHARICNIAKPNRFADTWVGWLPHPRICNIAKLNNQKQNCKRRQARVNKQSRIHESDDSLSINIFKII